MKKSFRTLNTHKKKVKGKASAEDEAAVTYGNLSESRL